jgi:hypothetical protein
VAGYKIQQNKYFKTKNVILRTQNIVNYLSKIGVISASNCDFAKVIIFLRGSHCHYLLWELEKPAFPLLRCLRAALTQDDAIGSLNAT